MLQRKLYIPFGEANGHAIDYLLGIIADARTTTLQRIYNLELEELHWQYAEGWNSISCLLAHIISIEHCFRIAHLERRALTAAEDKKFGPGMTMGKYIPELITDQPIDYYIKSLEEARKLMVDALMNLKEEDLIKKHYYKEGDYNYNIAWSLYHYAEDEVHHRGQISIIRKLYKHNKDKG